MARTCPILPVGESVREVLPVPADLTREIQERLKAKGFDPGPVDGKYGPKTAQALARFQDANPEQTGIDRALEIVDRRFRYASCATLNALGLRCSQVTCSPAIWAPIVGSDQAALLLCAAVAAAADRGLISLSCPLPAQPPAPGIPVWWVIAGTVGLVGVVTIGSVLWGRR